MVGIVQGVTVDGKTYVSLEDYQQLMKKYEDAVGTESNEQIIARVGVDEIPADDYDGCDGCKYENEDENGIHCAHCTHNAIDHYKPANRLDKIRALSNLELADYLCKIDNGYLKDKNIYDVRQWAFAQGEI